MALATKATIIAFVFAMPISRRLYAAGQLACGVCALESSSFNYIGLGQTARPIRHLSAKPSALS